MKNNINKPKTDLDLYLKIHSYKQSNIQYDIHSDILLKILIIGNSGVGKSCILMRYAENAFTTNFFNTIGVDFKVKESRIEGQNVKLQIWDTAGQERFRTITSSYYKGAHGIIIAYDVTDRESFDNIKNWMADIEKHASEGVVKLLIGNKNDMPDKRKVTFEEGLSFATQHVIPFYETSAKTSNNIDIVFQTMAKNIMQKNASFKKRPQITLKNETDQMNKDKKYIGGCC